MGNLSIYGADERLMSAAALFPDLELARVVSQYRDLYKIVTEAGEKNAEVSGRFRLDAEDSGSYPAVGDFVLIDRTAVDGNAIIQRLLPRRSSFERRAVGMENRAQIIAANVDIVFLCVSLNNNYSLNRVERYLSAAWSSGATPVVVLTKADLCDDLPLKIAEVTAAAIGADVVTTSSTDGESWKLLLPYLKPGVTASFIGSSGVGKSTLINRLAGSDVFETGGIRDDGKGRHTTTRRELIVLPCGGLVIDTPGMREFGIESADLSRSFSDIEELAASCRFSDCAHSAEPGCAVRAAIESGELDERRFRSYEKLKREARYDGLSSKEIESQKLNAMFAEVGGMKNARAFIRQQDKRRK